ncbi:MAG: sulfatase-like hydrolase/transferase [Candidatus Glassbacteria bacterium]
MNLFKVAAGTICLISWLTLFSCGRDVADGGPNVCLITLDTTRRDYLSCYDRSHAQTPNIDMVARQGILFSHAMTTVPVTLPAHASIMTGLYPPGHGVRNNGRYRLGDDVPTMAGLLSEAGYRTHAVIGAFPLDSQFGLDAGFEVYDDNMGGEFKEKPSFAFVRRSGDAVTDAAISFIESEGSSPFFLWVHYFDPHSPYDPPSPYDKRYRDDPYAGEIAFMDACLGRLLDKIDLSSTLTIIVGDHGEDLGDHGEMSHGSFLYESTVHVPLIISFPERLPEGLIIDEVVSVVDIFPTVFDILGMETAGIKIHGESLLPAIEGGSSSDRVIYIETRLPLEEMGWSPLEGVIRGEWKYIKAPREELYNVIEDPAEGSNLLENESGVAIQMRTILDSLKQEYETAGEAARFQADKETIEKLALLGYITHPVGAGEELRDPKDMLPVLSRQERGLRFFDRGRYEEAQRAFGEALKIDPTNITLINFRAFSLYYLGRLGEAMELWKLARELSPDNLETNLNLGMTYLDMGEADSALAAYEEVLARNPYYVRAIVGKGKAYRIAGDLDRAVEVLEEAIEVDPENPTARYWMGVCRKERGDLDGALREFEQAALLDDGLQQALREKAMVLIRLGRTGDAVEILRGLTSKAPSSSDLLLDLGYALENDGRTDEALETYVKATAIDTTSHIAYNNLGALLDKMGKVEEAERALKKALELKADFPEAYYNMGLLMKKLGRGEEAAAAFSKFLSLWNRNDDARERAREFLKELEDTY